ncbi:MAG: transglutaminase family protein [Clostridia bacterium]|nr:transglutaminase family protein [Clostridia bacterium]
MKRAVCIFLCIVFCFTLSGCSPVIDIIDLIYANDAVREVENKPYFAFSNGTLFKDSEETYLPAAHFDAEQSEYSQYRSSIYYNTLSPEEQYIYLALQYAMENCYKNVLVDSALAADTDTVVKVLQHLALDSPLLEQNLRYVTGTFTSSIPVNILGLYNDYADFDGFYISVDNFTKEMWDKKLEAITVAQQRVDALPDSLSLAEKAERLYLSLAQSVEYSLYDDDDNTKVFPYLYDALVTEKTHCDGHANALSLLLRLAGIEVCEKDYTPEKEGQPGHTWVTFSLDGQWYNADSTNGDLIPKKACSMKSGYYFGFSDDMRHYKENYDEVTPACKESLYMEPDGTLYGIEGNSFSSIVVDAFVEREPCWALIKVFNYNEASVKRQIQRCADQTYSTCYWMTLDVADGSTMVFVYQKGLF